MVRLASDTTPVHTHTPEIEPYVYCEAYQSVHVGTHDIEEFHDSNHGPYYDDIAQGYVDTNHPDFDTDVLIMYHSRNDGIKPSFIIAKP